MGEFHLVGDKHSVVAKRVKTTGLDMMPKGERRGCKLILLLERGPIDVNSPVIMLNAKAGLLTVKMSPVLAANTKFIVLKRLRSFDIFVLTCPKAKE